jgi:metal-responsive CopG/Arc/MetJ family transcriptional regulator
MRHKSRRIVIVSATLPISILDRIDKIVDGDKIPTRSYFIQVAVQKYLDDLKKIQHKKQRKT